MALCARDRTGSGVVCDAMAAMGRRLKEQEHSHQVAVKANGDC